VKHVLGMVRMLPQLLGYNPRTLSTKCANALLLLTGGGGGSTVSPTTTSSTTSSTTATATVASSPLSPLLSTSPTVALSVEEEDGSSSISSSISSGEKRSLLEDCWEPTLGDDDNDDDDDDNDSNAALRWKLAETPGADTDPTDPTDPTDLFSQQTILQDWETAVSSAFRESQQSQQPAGLFDAVADIAARTPTALPVLSRSLHVAPPSHLSGSTATATELLQRQRQRQAEEEKGTNDGRLNGGVVRDLPDLTMHPVAGEAKAPRLSIGEASVSSLATWNPHHYHLVHQTTRHYPTSSVGVAQALAVCAGSLNLDVSQAVRTVCTAPWILSYRSQRSQRILAVLAVSLGMNKEELTKCVVQYPRWVLLILFTSFILYFVLIFFFAKWWNCMWQAAFPQC
jgi:hypothetical protein